MSRPDVEVCSPAANLLSSYPAIQLSSHAARASVNFLATNRAGDRHAVTVHANQSRPSGPVTATNFSPRQRLRADHSATKTRSSTRWRPARSAVLREAMLSPSMVPISRRSGLRPGPDAQAA